MITANQSAPCHCHTTNETTSSLTSLLAFNNPSWIVRELFARSSHAWEFYQTNLTTTLPSYNRHKPDDNALEVHPVFLMRQHDIFSVTSSKGLLNLINCLT